MPDPLTICEVLKEDPQIAVEHELDIIRFGGTVPHEKMSIDTLLSLAFEDIGASFRRSARVRLAATLMALRGAIANERNDQQAHLLALELKLKGFD